MECSGLHKLHAKYLEGCHINQHTKSGNASPVAAARPHSRRLSYKECQASALYAQASDNRSANLDALWLDYHRFYGTIMGLGIMGLGIIMQHVCKWLEHISLCGDVGLQANACLAGCMV